VALQPLQAAPLVHQPAHGRTPPRAVPERWRASSSSRARRRSRSAVSTARRCRSNMPAAVMASSGVISPSAIARAVAEPAPATPFWNWPGFGVGMGRSVDMGHLVVMVDHDITVLVYNVNPFWLFWSRGY